MKIRKTDKSIKNTLLFIFMALIPIIILVLIVLIINYSKS